MKLFQELVNFFKQYFQFSGLNDWESGFRCGSFCAIATFLILIFLLAFLRLILFRKHQIKHLELDGPQGKYEISLAAISDLLAAKVAEFSETNLLKSRIYPARRNKCRIVLYVNYFPSESSAGVPDLVSKLQAETLSALSEIFGINSVETVAIRVIRARKKK